MKAKKTLAEIPIDTQKGYGKIKIVCFALLSLFINETRGQYSLAGVNGSLYVDVVPDTVLNPIPYSNGSKYYYIDINQDAISDIEIKTTTTLSPGSSISTVNISSLNSFTNFSLGSIDSTYKSGANCCNCWVEARNILKIYNNGDTIKNGNYVSSGYLGYRTGQGLCSVYADSPQWVNIGDVFFGIKYQTTSDTSFGWVKVNIPDYGNAIVKEFSLGSPLSGISSCNNTGFYFTVYPIPSNTIMNVVFRQGYNNKEEIKIINMLGETITSQKMQEKNDLQFNVNSLKEGVYFVSVKTSEGTVTKKIIIQR